MTFPFSKDFMRADNRPHQVFASLLSISFFCGVRIFPVVELGFFFSVPPFLCRTDLIWPRRVDFLVKTPPLSADPPLCVRPPVTNNYSAPSSSLCPTGFFLTRSHSLSPPAFLCCFSSIFDFLELVCCLSLGGNVRTLCLSCVRRRSSGHFFSSPRLTLRRGGAGWHRTLKDPPPLFSLRIFPIFSFPMSDPKSPNCTFPTSDPPSLFVGS